MATGYRSGGLDFDDLFDPYTSGAKAQASGRRFNGVDLSERYQALGGNQKRADVGYRVGGVDVSNLWLPKNSQGIASNFEPRLDVAILPGWSGPSNTTYAMRMLNTGSWFWQGGSQGTTPTFPWTSNSQPPAANYEVMISNVWGGGASQWSVTNNAPNWVPLNASTSQTLVTAMYGASSGPMNQYWTWDGGCTLSIRNAATGQVVWSGGMSIKCYAGQIRET